MAQNILQSGLINHQMSDDDIQEVITQRAAAAEQLTGAERDRALAEVKGLQHYLFMKRLLRPNGPRATDPGEVLSR